MENTFTFLKQVLTIIQYNYIHVNFVFTAQCPAVQDLTVKVDSLTSQVKDLTVANVTLQDRVDDLESIQVAARNNNILSDCISSAYLDILKRVRQVTKERIYSCMFLTITLSMTCLTIMI